MLSMTSLEREKFLILDAIFLICFFTLSVSASCDSSSFYASIPELSDGKPTTRTSWESILSQLNELLENTHNTVPYTSTNTDVVNYSLCEISYLLFCLILTINRMHILRKKVGCFESVGPRPIQ